MIIMISNWRILSFSIFNNFYHFGVKSPCRYEGGGGHFGPSLCFALVIGFFLNRNFHVFIMTKSASNRDILFIKVIKIKRNLDFFLKNPQIRILIPLLRRSLPGTVYDGKLHLEVEILLLLPLRRRRWWRVAWPARQRGTRHAPARHC